MQDKPPPDEILAAIARLMREELLPQMSGRSAFMLRVAANAVDLVQRQIALAAASDEEERARLITLLHHDGDLAQLNAELCAAIENGEIRTETPGLAEHLWTTTRAKLAVDQPNYAAYRRLANPPKE
ncbi:MAG TPA: DUF6285 domain-containing protein [Rhizomicrobium sp.]|jgi:hypothetical protein